MMRRFLRHTSIWLLALSFVASSAAWRQCVAAQPAAPVAAHQIEIADATSHDAHADHVHRHGDHGVNQQPVADQPEQPVNADHACGKCCSMCTVAGVVPPGIHGAALAVSSNLFSAESDNCVGTTVGIDPGIPKRIA